MNNRDWQILNKVLREIDIAMDMVDGVSETSFLDDEKLKRAVCMTLVNQHKDVPWREVAFRDVAAHKYLTLRMEDVYLTVTNDLPMLKIIAFGIENVITIWLLLPLWFTLFLEIMRQ